VIDVARSLVEEHYIHFCGCGDCLEQREKLILGISDAILLERKRCLDVLDEVFDACTGEEIAIETLMQVRKLIKER